MNNFLGNLLQYKDYFPLLIVTVTAILSYYFGKMKDNDNQKLESQEESLKLATSLYLEILDINKATVVEVQSIKEFVKRTFKNDQLYKLYDNDVLGKIKLLYLEIISNPNIEENIIKKFFTDIEKDMEKIYKARLKNILRDYELWNIKKNSHPFVAMVVIGSAATKKSMETILAIFSVLFLSILMELVTGSLVFNETQRGVILMGLMLSFLFWVIVTIVYKFVVRDVLNKKI